MPRDLPISNGSLMINFDHDYNIRDVYYPDIGQDNQTVGDISHFGIWCDGQFAWIHFDPHLWGNAIGDTIFLDPEFRGLVAYKARRYVLINGSVDDQFGLQGAMLRAEQPAEATV